MSSRLNSEADVKVFPPSEGYNMDIVVVNIQTLPIVCLWLYF